MHILIAPDSFKGSNTSMAVAQAIERGIRKVIADVTVTKIPIADGGEGTVAAAVQGGGGEFCEHEVTGPMGTRLSAQYGVLPGGRAVIEMAAASGLPLVPETDRNPLLASTYGTGELIKAALDNSCREFLIGIGGSATNDGGMGMARALGWKFLDEAGNELSGIGADLENVAAIDGKGADPRLKECTINVACDVINPLYGETGAAYVYGPQKGATPEMVLQLDKGLRSYAKAVHGSLGMDVSEVPGSGAAGGLGAGLIAFCGGQLKSGIEAMLDIVGFDEHLQDIDLVITGEGAIDGQSKYGKVPVGIAKRVKQPKNERSGSSIPVLAIVGDIKAGAEAVYAFGIDGIMSTVNRAMPLDEAMALSAPLLEDAAERVMRILTIGMRLGEQRS